MVDDELENNVVSFTREFSGRGGNVWSFRRKSGVSLMYNFVIEARGLEIEIDKFENVLSRSAVG